MKRLTIFKQQVNPPKLTTSDVEKGISKIHYQGRDNVTSPLLPPPKCSGKDKVAPESKELHYVTCRGSNENDVDKNKDLELSKEILNCTGEDVISVENIEDDDTTTISVENPNDDDSNASMSNEIFVTNDYPTTTSNKYQHDTKSSLSNEKLENIILLSQQGSNASHQQDGLSGVSEIHASFIENSVIHPEDHEARDVCFDPTDDQDSVDGPPSARDRGYAWVIVFNVFLIHLVCSGYVKSFGITYTLIMDYFPDATAAKSGLILSLIIGCRGILAPFVGALTVIVGPRRCMLIGVTLCVCGLLMAIPAISIPYLAFSLGALVGTGICMVETPGYILIADYFFEKRPLANGLSEAGNPMGGVIFSPLVVYLQQNFGLQGLFIILAGIMLQLLVSGMLTRPFEQHKKLVNYEHWREMRKEYKASSFQINQVREQRYVYERKKKKKPLDFSFFYNPSYLLYLLVGLLASFGLPTAILYAPFYGKSIGLTDFENSAVASFTCCSDVVMRLFCGFLFNKKKMNTRYGFIAGLMVGGVGCFIVPLCSDMWYMLIFAVMLSFCMAFHFTLLNVLLADQFGGDAMATTYGFYCMLQGVCYFVNPIVIGLVVDYTGGLTIPYLMMGSLIILAALTFACQPLVAKLPRSKINLT